MSSSNDSKQPVYSNHGSAPAAPMQNTHQTPAPQAVTHYAHQVSALPEQSEDMLIQKGKVFAHTVNAPFTTIPRLPAATALLRKFDKATNQDLGFTFKASTSSQDNSQGGKDLIYRVDYVGLGLMSSKFNVQVAPIAAKIGIGDEVYKGFGCNASILATPVGPVHERVGVKATFTDCNGDSKSLSAAAEVSYNKSTNFRPISTFTFGYYSGNDATIHIPIPAEYVPYYDWLMANTPTWEESITALEHIAPAITSPLVMGAAAIGNGVELAETVLKSAAPTVKSMFESAAKLEVNTMRILTHQDSTQSSATTVKSILPVPNGDSSPNATHAFAKRVPQTPAIDHQPYNPSYKVQIKPGDTLRDIAAREKGDAGQYIAIAKKNHIKDPDRIFPTNEKSLDVPGYEPSNDEKATYTVRAGDTLDIIGKKTGHTSAEIFALNQKTLKNNPDKIYPGQELLIPDDHAALINNPVVQARIREIIAKQQANEYTR